MAQAPADPELLTRKAERLIRAADIVFFDALGGPGVLDLIPVRVEQVSGGKRSGRHSKDQGTICDLLECWRLPPHCSGRWQALG